MIFFSKKRPIKASFCFRDKKQQKQWKRYLIEAEETQQEALRRLIDKAVQDDKDLKEWADKTEKYTQEKMK